MKTIRFIKQQNFSNECHFAKFKKNSFWCFCYMFNTNCWNCFWWVCIRCLLEWLRLMLNTSTVSNLSETKSVGNADLHVSLLLLLKSLTAKIFFSSSLNRVRFMHSHLQILKLFHYYYNYYCYYFHVVILIITLVILMAIFFSFSINRVNFKCCHLQIL